MRPDDSNTAPLLNAALARAADARREKDWPALLAALETVNRATLAPREQIQVLMMRGQALHSMGEAEQSAEQFRTALSLFAGGKFLNAAAPDPKTLATAEMLAIGARDTKAVQNLIAFRAAQFFETPRKFKISPVVEILGWCRANGLQITVLDPAGPVVAQAIDDPSQVWRYEVGQAWAVTIPGGEIICGWDFAIAPTGEVLEGGNYMPIDLAFPFMPHLLNPELNLVAHPWRSEPIVVDEDVLHVGTPERYAYGHWLNDFLPRLRAWRGTGRQKIVIPDSLPTKHRDLLARFGVEPDDLIECALGARYRFRTLTIVQAGRDLKPQPESLHFVRDALATAPALRPSRRFFLVRDAGTRLPANEAELDRVLAAFGIEKVNPAKWTLGEQERLLAETKLIVAAFGTELLCMYHLPKGADVIEISLDSTYHPVFGPKSAILGLRHHFVPCQSTESGRTEMRKLKGDLVIDCEALRGVLEGIAAQA